MRAGCLCLRRGTARRLVIAAVLTTVLRTGSPAGAQEKDSGRPQAPVPRAPDGDASPQLSRKQIESLGHIVYHERRAVVLLQRARAFLERGQLSQAFDALQVVLGDPQELLDADHNQGRAPSDSLFVQSDRLKSVRRETLRIFESLTVEQRKFYEATYGQVANEAFKRAEQSGSLTALLEVARRCFPTLAGAQAVDAAATRLLDQGRPGQAARLWLSVVRSDSHRNRLHPRLYEKAATALFLDGDEAQAQEVVQEAIAVFGEVRFSLSTIEAVGQIHALLLRDRRGSSGLPFGDAASNGITKASVPYLSPVWSQPLYEGEPLRMLADWERDRADAELAELGVSVFPIVTHGQLVSRDLNGIRSVDPATGKLLWRFRGSMSAYDFLREIRSNDSRGTDSQLGLVWTENSTLGIVTSDGQRVFAIDWLEYASDEPRDIRRQATIRRSNRVVCLEIPDQEQLRKAADNGVPSVEPLWTAGGLSNSSAEGALSGHVFLGPPLPLDDAVYVISESWRDRELNLVKLESSSGRVVWIQKLGLVEQRIFDSSQRFRELPMALPVAAGGTIVCCADSGYIVAVDSAFGEIDWLYDYVNAAPARSYSPRFRAARGFRGLPSPPVIHSNSVLCMPQHSDDIHCINLKTGVGIWRASRSDDEYYVAAVSDGTVATVTREGMRGISLQDGSEVWSSRIGLPSGRGVHVGANYLLPLKTGGVATVDLESGDWTKSSVVPSIIDRRYRKSLQHEPLITQTVREYDLAKFGLADERVPDYVRPGNLLFYEGLVFSAGPQHLTAFPEVATILKQFRQQSGEKDPSHQLLVSQLELASGNEKSAAVQLAKLAEGGGAEGSTGDRARWLLRDLLTSRLNKDRSDLPPEERLAMVDQLTRFSTLPTEQEHALIERARWEATNRSLTGAVHVARQAVRVGAASFVPLPGRQDCLVTSDAWSRQLTDRALQESTPADRVRLQRMIEQDYQVAISIDTIDSLQSFLTLFAAAPEAGRIRNRLADRLIRQGRLQEAELLLLQNQKHSDAEIRAVSEVLLISLWSKNRLSFEVGDALYRISRSMSDVSLDDVLEDRLMAVLDLIGGGGTTLPGVNRTDGAPFTVGDFVAGYEADEAARQVYEELSPLNWKVQRIEVTQQSLSSPETMPLAEVWKDSPHRIYYGRHSEFDIVRDRNRLQSRWKILDRLAGTERGFVMMPARVSPARSTGYSTVGHLIPVGTPAGMQAVSLLEFQDERPLWSTSFPPLEPDQTIIEPGPATPIACIFQTRKHLFGMDPADGRILWRRSDLDLGSGVHVDREAGLFGDENVLVMFHADQQHYTMMATQTGETLREGKVSVDFRYPRRVTGRRLFHVTVGDNSRNKRIRIWDPLTNQMEFDEPLGERFYFAWAASGELALLTADGRLRIFAPESSEVLVDVRIPKDDIRYLSSLRIFSDQQRFFVNLQRSHVAGGESEKIYSLASDSVIPLNSVHRGLLFAVSRNSGKIVWKRPVQQRSFVRIDHASLPFLVGLSRVSPKRNNRKARNLEVRILDRQTGRDLIPLRSLAQDRIVHVQLDRNAGELVLYGLNSQIDIDFKVPLRQIELQEQPL